MIEVNSPYKYIWVIINIVLLAVIVFLVAKTIIKKHNKNEVVKKIPPQESLPPNPKFPKNDLGETYGSGLDSSPYERGPDLIKAMGIDGTIGYVRRTEADGPMPKTPEEALAMQAKQINPRYINLYECDGKTIIGEFKIGSSDSKEQPQKKD
jgi:hypothetical protein